MSSIVIITEPPIKTFGNNLRTHIIMLVKENPYIAEPRKSQWMYNGVAVSQEEEQSLNNWKVVALIPGPCCLHFVVSLGKILNS